MTNDTFNDNSDMTYHAPADNSVRASWQELRLVSWVRVVFDATAEVQDFKLYYSGLEKMWRYNEPNILRVPGKANAFDLDCEVSILVYNLNITWSGKGALCTVNVCGGRNLAQVKAPYIESITNMATSLNDGDVSDRNCNLLVQSGNRTVVFDMGFNVLLDRVSIYTVPGVTSAALEFRFLDKKGETMFYERLDLVKNEMVHMRPVRNATFYSLHIDVIHGEARLCEIELYGECADDKYGLLCDGICSLTCNRHRCAYDGRCLGCSSGRWGDHCREGEKTPRSPSHEGDLDGAPGEGEGEGQEIDVKGHRNQKEDQVDNSVYYVNTMLVMLLPLCCMAFCVSLLRLPKRDSLGNYLSE